MREDFPKRGKSQSQSCNLNPDLKNGGEELVWNVKCPQKGFQEDAGEPEKRLMISAAR